MQVKLGFGWELALQIGVIFFKCDLKTLCIKNNEYKSQAKKMIQVVISTISHFWFLDPITFWQPVFVPLFSMVYTPPTLKYFLQRGLRRAQSFLCLVARDWEDFKFWGYLLYWGDLISFLEEGARPSSIKPSMNNHVNQKIVDGKIICFVCTKHFTLLIGNFLFENFLSA